MKLFQLFDEANRMITHGGVADFDDLKQRGLDEHARRPEGQFRIEAWGGIVPPFVMISRLDGETRTWTILQKNEGQ